MTFGPGDGDKPSLPWLSNRTALAVILALVIIGVLLIMY